MTPSKQEISDLTVCRAFFAAWVFIYHADLYVGFSAFLGPFRGLVTHGYLGVDGFFILSGLILARVHPEMTWRPLAKRNPKFRLPPLRDMLTFWGKRLARIYPVHLATIALLAALVALGEAHGWAPRDPARFGVQPLVWNLLLVHGWGVLGQDSWNYPSWSISSEWAGYLLFPLLGSLFMYFDAIVALQVAIVGFTAIGMVFVVHGYSLNLFFGQGLYRFFPEFISGMAASRFVYMCADFAALRRWFLRGGAVLTIASAALGFDLTAVAGLWLVLFAFLMQADSERPPMLGNSRALHWLGGLSYAFYMSFAVAELVMSQALRRAGWAPQDHGPVFVGGMLALTFALAVVLHYAVEVPCRRAAGQALARFAPAKA